MSQIEIKHLKASKHLTHKQIPKNNYYEKRTMKSDLTCFSGDFAFLHHIYYRQVERIITKDKRPLNVRPQLTYQLSTCNVSAVAIHNLLSPAACTLTCPSKVQLAWICVIPSQPRIVYILLQITYLKYLGHHIPSSGWVVSQMGVYRFAFQLSYSWYLLTFSVLSCGKVYTDIPFTRFT